METRIKVLVPRRSKEERKKNYLIAINKKVQEYIKNGSKGDLDLSNTPITSLPDNLVKVGGYLSLYGIKIVNLPDNLTEIEGSLDLDDTPITSLPERLKVGGNLWLRNTSITNLPKDLKVEGSLYLRNTPISKQYTVEQIIRMVPGVKGNIFS